MTRTLAPGRITKQDPGDTIRRNGLIASFSNKGIYGNYLDQYLFEGHGYEHILGTANDVSADIATMTWDFVSGRFEDKAGSEVVLDDWDRIAVIGMNTLTGNITIDNVDNLTLFHIGNAPGESVGNPEFKLGDAGSGVPYKIFLGTNTNNCRLDLLTDKTFAGLDRLNLTQPQKQFIANQGRGNYVRVNGEEIYNPSLAGDIIKRSTAPLNPYFLRMDASQWPWQANAAVNGLAWFRDLNVRLDGQRWNGSAFVETNGRFTTPAVMAATAYLFQVGKANRFFTDISSLDTRVHQRADPTGVSISKTVDFNGTNVFTITSGDTNRIANNMRIQGGTVPGSPTATTIIRNFNTATLTGEMYNALTGAAVNVATATGVSATIDNSGAAGGSHDTDYFQNITGQFDIRDTTAASMLNSAAGAFTFTADGGTGADQGITASPPNVDDDLLQFDASNSPSARTHDQTQPKSSGAYYYYRA